MNKTVKIYIGVRSVLALIVLAGTIGFIVSRNGPMDSISWVSIALILYLFIFFGIITYLYLTNSWIFENYEHSTDPTVYGAEFNRPYGVHTIPVTNNCTVNSDGTVTDENGYVYDPKNYDSGTDFINAWITGTPSSKDPPGTKPSPCKISCPDGFSVDKNIHPNAKPCMNTQKQVICSNGIPEQTTGSCPAN